MADLTDNQTAQPVKVIGSDSTGVEQTPIQSTPNGAIHVNLRDSAGNIVGTQANPIHNKVSFEDDQTIVGNGLLAVANATSVFEHFYKSGLGPNVWTSATSGGATESFHASKRIAELTVPTTSGAYVYRQTRKRFRYYPGRAVQASMTFNPNGTQANIRKRFGYFDVNDGMFLEFNGTDIRFIVRTSGSGAPVDSIVIPRSSWYDPLDGTGPSGQTIDFTKTIFMMIEFLWQGAGYVKLSFLQGRRQLIAVERNFFGSINGITEPYIANPTLPFRVEIENTATSTGTTIGHICSALRVYVDNLIEGIPVAINNGIIGKSVTNTPVLSLRVRSSTPTRLIELTSADCFIGGNNTAYVNIYLNPTLTGAVWTQMGSCSEYDISATSFTGGALIGSGIIRGNTPISLSNLIPYINNVLGEDINGVKDIVTIVVQSFSGTITANATLEWKEI